jgi:predicted secreted protein
VPANPAEGTITVRVGETRTVTLPGRGGAGYAWEAHADDRAILEVAECPVEPPSLPGASFSTGGIAQTFALRGLRPGKTVVHFVERRPFAPEHVLAEHHQPVIVS